MRVWIGTDNGVSGSIGITTQDQSKVSFFPVPVIRILNYTRDKKYIHRINYSALETILTVFSEHENSLAVVERPMINSQRFTASISAARALEATLIVLEKLNIGIRYIDSKQWQRVMLPKGLKGPELKTASLDIGIRLFPQFKEQIIRQKDADGLLIAEWARLENL